MLAPLFFLLLTSSQIQSQKLTTEENELNTKNCGVHFLGQPIQQNRLVKKSYGGREFEESEYPWTAFMNIGKEKWCSGVQISPRHILTAAHCVLDFDLVRSSMLCAINQSHSNDLALIELVKDVSESDSTPICMPSPDLPLSPVLYAAGSGYSPSSPITFNNPFGLFSHGQQVVALRYHAVDQILHQIQTKTFAKITCEGDSGGPLFQVEGEGRHTLVGITSHGDRCTEHSENLIDHYTDVRAHLDWICKYSGVCPVEEESQF